MSRKSTQLAVFICAVAVLLVAAYWPFLSGQSVFFFKDTTDFFEPLCGFIGKGLAAGRLPLWNPYNYCGMSQAAICSPSIFFPPNWLFAGLSFSQALAIIMILSQLVCAVGMFLLVDSVGWGTLSGAIAASGMALSGYMFSLSTNYTLVAAAGWMPLTIYCSRQVLRNPRVAWIAANAVAIFMLLTSGRPEISAPAMVLALGAAFCRLPAEKTQECASALAPAALLRSVVIGFLLAAPMLLPLLEWIPWSRRAQGLAADEVLMYSAGWYDLLCMFLPQPLGSLQLRDSPFAALVGTATRMPYYGAAFVSCILLAFASLGIFRRGGRAHLLCLLAMLVSLIASLGENIPFMQQLVSVIPGASLLRFPNKLLIFPVFFLSLFAARGAYMYCKGAVRLGFHIVGWAIVCLLLGVLYVSPNVVLPFASTGEFHDQAIRAQQLIAGQAVLQTGIVVAVLSALYMLSRRQRTLVGLFCALVVLAILLAFNARNNGAIAGRPDFFERPSFVLKILNLPDPTGRIPRITNLAIARFTLPAQLSTKHRLESTVNNFEYARQMLRPFGNMDFSAPSAHGFEGAMVGEYYHFFVEAFFRSSQASIMPSTSGESAPATRSDLLLYRLLQVGATEYVINQVYHAIPGGFTAVPPLDANFFAPVASSTPGNVRIWRLRQPLPRIYLASTWRSFSSRDDLLAYFVGCGNNGFDPAKETLVEGSTEAPPAVPESLLPLIADEPRPEVLNISVRNLQRRLLVLQDQYYPGWQASVDGATVPILRVNGFMKGVMLTPGEHKVSFVFQPISVFAGGWLALAGGAWLLLIYWMSRRRNGDKETSGNA